MRFGKQVFGGEEKVLTQREVQISIGSSLRREYGSWCWCCLLGFEDCVVCVVREERERK